MPTLPQKAHTVSDKKGFGGGQYIKVGWLVYYKHLTPERNGCQLPIKKAILQPVRALLEGTAEEVSANSPNAGLYKSD